MYLYDNHKNRREILNPNESYETFLSARCARPKLLFHSLTFFFAVVLLVVAVQSQIFMIVLILD